MASSIWDSIRNISWTRDKSGKNTYLFNEKSGAFGNYDKVTNLELSQNHPILTPALLFVSKLFSQAELKIVDKTTSKEKPNHWLSKILSKPNPYQTQNDFLESLMFIQLAQGKAVGYLKRPIGFDKDNADIDSIYILDSDKIKWPENYASKFISTDSTALKEQTIVYDKKGENLTIKIKDLLFFYDLPNCFNKNFFESRSRIDGLRQTLINTYDSLIAKNIILKTNGKEIIGTGANDNFPLVGQDKKDAETLLQNDYGLGWNRKRGIVTSASVTYQSMHIALRDLGLDESVKVDGNIIYTALHIPKDILSLEAKKTTYNNFKESMVSYIQNEMEANLNSFLEVLQQLITEPNLKIVGSYDHLPTMQFILKEKYESHKLRAEALTAYLSVGVPENLALEFLGFDRNVTLEAPKVEEPTNEDSTNDKNL